MNDPTGTQGFRSPSEGFAAAWARAWELLGVEGGPFNLALRSLEPRHGFGLGWGLMDQPFETLLGLPRLADVPALDRKLLALLGGWVVLSQHCGEYGAVVARVWAEAYFNFINELYRVAAEERPIRSIRELLDRWAAAVNHKLMSVQRSEEFLAAQRRLFEALLSSRVRERDVIEIFAQLFDLPTRTEMDDVHRALHGVKRELRALRRELRAAEARGDVPVPTVETARSQRSSARRQGSIRKDGGNGGVPHRD